MKRVKWLGNVALAVLLLIDIALVVLVFTRHAGAVAGDTAPLTPVVSSSTAHVTNTSAAPRATLVAGLLSVPDGKNVWSATKGTCGKGGATVSFSDDGGATWTPAAAQPYSALTRIGATSDRVAFAVGADATCKVTIRGTSNGAASWRTPSDVSTSWAVDLADPTIVHSTTGSKSTPCGSVHVTAFARTSDSVGAVLCDDGSTQMTTDAGKAWAAGPSLAKDSTLKSLVGFAASGSGSSARLVVAASASNCTGVAIATSIGGDDFVRAACVGPIPAKTVPVALAPQDDSTGTMWLLAGTDLWRASGGFTAWTRT